MKKVPLQVHLEKNFREQIRLVAKRQKVSQSELVRKYLYQGLKRDLEQEDPALDIIGLGNGKTTDMAKKHDHYLALEEKAFWKE